MTGPQYTWAVFSKATKGKGGYSVRADRMEVTPTGALVFFETKTSGETVVHVQAPGTYETCEILSALTGYPTHTEKLIEP
jgi:hypothetical protein